LVDGLDLSSIRRLVKSLSRFLFPEDALKYQGTMEKGPEGFEFIKSLPIGSAYILRKLWERLGIG